MEKEKEEKQTEKGKNTLSSSMFTVFLLERQSEKVKNYTKKLKLIENLKITRAMAKSNRSRSRSNNVIKYC